jgi:hypothetical protein
MPFSRVLTNRTFLDTRRMRGLKQMPVNFHTSTYSFKSGEQTYSTVTGGIQHQVDFERDEFEDDYRCRKCGHEWTDLSHADRTEFEV